MQLSAYIAALQEILAARGDLALYHEDTEDGLYPAVTPPRLVHLGPIPLFGEPDRAFVDSARPADLAERRARLLELRETAHSPAAYRRAWELFDDRVRQAHGGDAEAFVAKMVALHAYQLEIVDRLEAAPLAVIL
jgi:hypothetical protein